MSAYAKAVVAFFASLGTWGATVFADGRADTVEWFGLCGVAVATFGVWVTPNRTPPAVERPVDASWVEASLVEQRRRAEERRDPLI